MARVRFSSADRMISLYVCHKTVASCVVRACVTEARTERSEAVACAHRIGHRRAQRATAASHQDKDGRGEK